MRPRLLVFAKEPAPGAVKTRLVPPLSAQAAADLAAACVADTLRAAAAVDGIDVWLAVTPAGAAPAFAPHGVPCVAQADGDLGRRMCAALAGALADGAPAAAVLGSDSPDLPPSVLAAAFAALQEHDAVVGGCPDGGFYLLGVRRPPALDLLAGIAWSSGGEGAATRERLRAVGSGIAELPVWPDLDTPADLYALAARLAGSPGVAPHVEAWLRAHGGV